MAADLISLIIAGDSHAYGFCTQRVGVKVRGRTMPVEMKSIYVDGAYAAMDMVVTFPDGRIGLNPELQAAFRAWPGLARGGVPAEGGTAVKHAVLSFGLGLAHYDPGVEFNDRAAERLLFPADVDFVLPGYPQLPTDPDLTLAPVALIRDMYEAILAPMKQALPLLAADHPKRTWVMAAPPPARDTAALRDLFSRRNVTLAIPSSVVQLKIWLLLRDLVRRMATEAGCGFIDCADFACDKGGFLKPEFVNDGIHGNSKYLDLMSERVLTAVVSSETAPG